MKNSNIKNFAKTLYIRIIMTFSLYTFLGIIIYFVTKYIYSFKIWYSDDTIYNFVHWLDVKKEMIFVFYIIIGYTAIFGYFLMKVLRNIQEIINSFKKINDEKSDLIELSYDLKEIENEMNKAKFQFLENLKISKNAEQRKNDLIVYMAHDIKTPLTSTIGYLSLVDEIKDMPKVQREKYISIALDKSYKLELLINELFDIARFNEGTNSLLKEETNINLMLEQIIDDFYPLLSEKQKTISLKCDEALTLNVDINKIARAINNIIKNAIIYSNDKSEIIISVKKDSQFGYITIRNEGKFISDEDLEKIFEKFYRLDSSRTSNSSEGNGLGLAIAKDIINLHKGNITARNDDKHIEFCVSIPFKS